MLHHLPPIMYNLTFGKTSHLNDFLHRHHSGLPHTSQHAPVRAVSASHRLQKEYSLLYTSNIMAFLFYIM